MWARGGGGKVNGGDSSRTAILVQSGFIGSINH